MGDTYPSGVVGGSPTHVVVHRRQHWYGLFGDVNTCKDLGSLGDAREACGQNLWREVTELQQDMVRLRAHSSEE